MQNRQQPRLEVLFKIAKILDVEELSVEIKKLMFKKGDILLPLNRVNRREWLNGLFHPAVVLDNFYDGNSDFQGIMLTHTAPNGQFNNILMADNHFENGNEVVFSNTHFVN